MADERSGSVGSKVAIGAGWMILWRLVSRVLGTLSTLVLARLLVPADFGLVAIATTLVVAIDSLSLLGLHDAIIRSPKADRSLFDTAFTLTAMRAAITGGLLALSAGWVAVYFSEPRLEAVIYCLALLALLEGFENIAVVEFRRDLNFRNEFLLFLAPRLTGVVFGIIFAFALRNYWALVGSIALQRIVRLAMSYRIHSYRPGFSFSAWRELLGFSLWAWASSVVQFTKDRFATLILGRNLDSAAVGTFLLGSEIALSPASEIAHPISRVLLSGFAYASRTGGDVVAGFRRAVGIVATMMLPAGIGISAVAGLVVSVALGSAWLSAIPVLQILGFAAPLISLAPIGAMMLIARGHLSLNFGVSLVAAIIVVVGSIVMIQFGDLRGIAWTMTAAGAFEAVGLLSIAMHRLGASPWRLAGDLWRPLLATAAMAAVLLVTGFGWDNEIRQIGPAIAAALGAVILGAATYVAALAVLWWMAGRPDGAESYIVRLALQYLGGLPGIRRGQGSART